MYKLLYLPTSSLEVYTDMCIYAYEMYFYFIMYTFVNSCSMKMG